MTDAGPVLVANVVQPVPAGLPIGTKVVVTPPAPAPAKPVRKTVRLYD